MYLKGINLVKFICSLILALIFFIYSFIDYSNVMRDLYNVLCLLSAVHIIQITTSNDNQKVNR
jgi:hypothetical protein